MNTPDKLAMIVPKTDNPTELSLPVTGTEINNLKVQNAALQTDSDRLKSLEDRLLQMENTTRIDYENAIGNE